MRSWRETSRFIHDHIKLSCLSSLRLKGGFLKVNQKGKREMGNKGFNLEEKYCCGADNEFLSKRTRRELAQVG